jgi:hypothetical protein
VSSDRSIWPRRYLTMLNVTVIVIVSACQASPTIAPETVPQQLASSSATAKQDLSPSPSAALVAGGCGATQAFAGPGPAAAMGLADNPWATATPPQAGITAYFWGHPPDLIVARSPGTSNTGAANKVLWINDGPGYGHLLIAAHPFGKSTPIVQFDIPSASAGFPSIIDLPTPGCWQLELTLAGTRATLEILAGSAP